MYSVPGIDLWLLTCHFPRGSKGVAHILGLTQEELIGKRLVEFVHLNHVEEYQVLSTAHTLM